MLSVHSKKGTVSLTQGDRYAVAIVGNLHIISPHLLRVSADSVETSIQGGKRISIKYCAWKKLPNLDYHHIVVEELDEPTESFFSPRQLSSKVVVLAYHFRICVSVAETHNERHDGLNRPDSSTAWLSCSAPRIKLSSSSSGGKLKCSGFLRRNFLNLQDYTSHKVAHLWKSPI
jgi:hypothetical protein